MCVCTWTFIVGDARSIHGTVGACQPGSEFGRGRSTWSLVHHGLTIVGRSTNGMLQGILVHWCHDPQPLGVQNKETPQFDLWEHPKPFTKSY